MKTNLLRNAHSLASLAIACLAVCIGDCALAQTPGTAADTPDQLEDLTPKRYKIDRYKSIWAERSPFEIIVEDEGPPVDEDPPFEDYSLAGYSKRGNVWHVTVVNIKDPKEKHYLESGQVSKEGFELLNFKPERNYKKSEVVVRRGGKSGSIGFDEKRLRPSTGAKGSPIGNAKSQPNAKSKNQPRGRTQPNTARKPGTPATTGGAKKNDAAAQIRQMLQNRANQSQARGGGGTSTQGAQKKPRRRVILPPSR